MFTVEYLFLFYFCHVFIEWSSGARLENVDIAAWFVYGKTLFSRENAHCGYRVALERV